jgi:hypothetical protein
MARSQTVSMFSTECGPSGSIQFARGSCSSGSGSGEV